jgi:hypothetical protein
MDYCPERSCRDVGTSQATQDTVSEPAHVHSLEPIQGRVYELTTKRGRVLHGTFDRTVATPTGEFVNLLRLQPGQRIQLRPPTFANTRYKLKWKFIPGAICSVEIDEDWALF